MDEQLPIERRGADSILRELCELQEMVTGKRFVKYDDQRRYAVRMQTIWREARIAVGLPVEEKMQPSAMDARELRRRKHAGERARAKGQ